MVQTKRGKVKFALGLFMVVALSRMELLASLVVITLSNELINQFMSRSFLIIVMMIDSPWLYFHFFC